MLWKSIAPVAPTVQMNDKNRFRWGFYRVLLLLLLLLFCLQKQKDENFVIPIQTFLSVYVSKKTPNILELNTDIVRVTKIRMHDWMDEFFFIVPSI